MHFAAGAVVGGKQRLHLLAQFRIIAARLVQNGSAMLRLGFEELGLHRIVARIEERNEPSVKLARRLGMRQEARLVDNEFFKGEWSTEVDFAMLAEEWYRLARR